LSDQILNLIVRKPLPLVSISILFLTSAIVFIGSLFSL